MGSAAYAYSVPRCPPVIPGRRRDHDAIAATSAHPQPGPSIELPLAIRVAIILGGAVIGWAVPIACAVTLS